MSTLLALDSDFHSLIVRLGAVLAITYVVAKYIEARKSPLNAIPTVGYSGVLTSYITAFKFMIFGAEMLREGSERYPNTAFKIANISRWKVVLNGRTLLDDVRKASDDYVSFEEAVEESMQSKYTFGMAAEHESYTITTVRSQVTRNLLTRFDDITDEIMESFKDYLPPSKDWVSVPAYETMMHIICRTSNRYFVGLPLCREPGYRALNENFTIEVAVGATILNRFPALLRPLVAKYVTAVPKSVKRAMGYLGPMIQERLDKEEQYGVDWPDKPNDLISWLLETATEENHRTVRDLVLRVLGINFAAIHTSTMTFTHALYDLAIHPEYVKEMREEAESTVKEHGWSKLSMQRMRKIDSFLKESQRLNSIANLLMDRKVLQDWRLSDGTLLPAGTNISFANWSFNRDEESFQDAHAFKGFRFYDKRNGDGELDSIKYQMVSLNLDQISFGHGKHACPGRFFAVNEVKAMFAYVLLNYDVQLEGGSLERPKNLTYGHQVSPNRTAKVMFRKRVVA